MKNSRLILVFFLLFSTSSHAVSVGDSVIEFSLPEFGDPSKTFALSDYNNQILYIDFWASWCVPCRKSFPFMNRLHEQYGQKGVKVVAINMDESPKDAEKFLKRFPAKFTILKGLDKVGTEFELKGLPVAFLVSKSGEVISIHEGFSTQHANSVEEKIKSLIKQ